MISVRQIVLLAEQGSFQNLARRILANGRLRSAALDRALMDRQAVAPCAVALALQRCCELTYGPTEETALLASRLLRLQAAHEPGDTAVGRFAPDSPHWVTATALAVRALLDYRQQLGDEAGAAANRLKLAVDRGLQAIQLALRSPTDPEFSQRTHAVQSTGGPAPDRPTLAVILWQLGDEPTISRRLGLDRVRHALSDHDQPPIAGCAFDADSPGCDPVTCFALAAA